MATVDELLGGSQSPLNADLAAGVEAISANQTITFTKYVRVVLPLDGFVFWVRADIVSEAAIANATAFNVTAPGAPIEVITPAPYVVARGSLHYASEKKQDETESYSVNRVVFTAIDPVHQDFNQIGPACILIGELDGIRFAFDNRQNFYRQADLYHYIGDAIYPYMESQIIDNVAALPSGLVVSNSLPFWLRLNDYHPFYGFGNSIPLYPSHLSPPNLRPPFATVHIYPESTVALVSAPRLGRRYSHEQLSRDRVRVTFYGANNAAALTFHDCVMQYSADYGYIGMANVPVMQDEKSSQNELGILAMKKMIEFEVNYYQSTARDMERQIICQAIPSFELIEPTWRGQDPFRVAS